MALSRRPSGRWGIRHQAERKDEQETARGIAQRQLDNWNAGPDWKQRHRRSVRILEPRNKMTTELPTLEDAEHLVDNGYAEPLDEFVARWQPKHHIDTRIWRKDLQKVLDGYEKGQR